MKLVKHASEASLVMMGQALFLVGSLFSVRLLTDILSPSTFGQMALGLTIAQGFVIIFYGPISNGIARYQSISSKNKISITYLSGVKVVLLSCSIKVAVLGGIGVASFYLFDKKSLVQLTMFATVFAISTGYAGALASLLNAARKRNYVALYQGCEPWIKVGIALVFLHLIDNSAYIAIAGFATACAMLALLLFIAATRYSTGDADLTGDALVWRKNIQIYASTFSKFAIFTWAYSVSDRWVINQFLTLSDVGIYAVAYMLGYLPMVAISNVFIQYATPIIYELLNINSTRESKIKGERVINILTYSLLLFSVLSFGVLSIFGERILALMTSADYVHASEIMPWLALAGGLFVAGESRAILLNASLNQSIQIRPKIITALIGIVLNIIGVSILGIKGVAYACLLFSVIYFSWMSFIAGSIQIHIKDK